MIKLFKILILLSFVYLLPVQSNDDCRKIFKITDFRNNEVCPSPNLPNNYLTVPIFQQTRAFTCGPSSLRAVLFYWKVYFGSEKFLSTLLETKSERGTDSGNIVSVARQFGLKAYKKEKTSINDLKEGLEKGQTIILDLQAWPEEVNSKISWLNRWNDGHYVVLVGMDEWYLYFMDPFVKSSAYTYLLKSKLMERWHDYEILDGRIYKYQQLAIFITGKENLISVP